MTNDSLIEKLESIKSRGIIDENLTERQYGRNCAIDEAIAIVRQHQAQQPQDVVERDIIAEWHQEQDARNQVEDKPSGYSVEKDPRQDCPWKCKSGDAKCLCANQREISVVEDAALEIAEKAYNDWCDETEEIAGERYCHEVPLRVAIDAYLRTSPINSLLQWQAQEITRLRLRKPKPVSVSLEQCINAAGQACDDLDWAMGDPWEDDLPALVKAVLDAAGVKYVD